MAGLDLAIHASAWKRDVDARLKAGHERLRASAVQ
jgi:hypothetical protein